MPALLIYLIKVNIALLIFCLGYYAVLRHLTFYTLNRIYLVIAILFSTLYPRVNLSDFINRHEQIAKPIQVIVVNWQEPIKTVAKTFLGYDIWQWIQAAFWTGVCLFGIRLLTQLLSLYRLHQRSEPVQLSNYMIRVIKGDINPFSFWRSIYINPANHSHDELDAILEHEQIHVNEWHTLDILLGEISAVCYWFNPGIWLMKRAIRENIEFITDRKILLKGVDCKAYQYSLLSVNFGTQSNAIVNHFNISTIKKRIIMMNAKRSSSVNITRYLLLVPVVMALLLVFSTSKAELTRTVSKSSANVIKVLKAAVTKIDFTADKTIPAHQQQVTKNLIAMADTTPNTNTSQPVVDTVRKNVLVFKSKDGKNVKPEIYIDGVKSDNDLTKVDPNQIYSIDVKKNLPATPNGVIYITTKAHAPKNGMSKIVIDTVKNATLKANHIFIDSFDTITATDANGTIKKGKTITVVSSTNGNVIVGDTLYTSGTVTLSASPHWHPAGIKDTASNSRVVVVRGYAAAPGTAHSSPLVLDHVSDKLIVLNGKISTQKELKKVSAADIDSISILKAEAGMALYGDKAKNGVLIISTKK